MEELKAFAGELQAFETQLQNLVGDAAILLRNVRRAKESCAAALEALRPAMREIRPWEPKADNPALVDLRDGKGLRVCRVRASLSNGTYNIDTSDGAFNVSRAQLEEPK